MGAFKTTSVLRQEFPRGEAHTFDYEAFNEAIRSQGVEMVHFRAMGCPGGLTGPDDHLHHFHHEHGECSKGFLYKKRGTVIALFVGNTGGPDQHDIGTIEGSRVQVTVPQKYEDSDVQVYLSPFDRLYLADSTILWGTWERFEHNLSGRDRLGRPTVAVEHLVDDRLEEYTAGVDFIVQNGEIVWTGNRRPGINAETGKGRTCSAWYLFQPYWYVERLSHQARIVQAEDEHGVRRVVRMPFQASLVREITFEDQERKDDASTGQGERAMPGGEDGSFPAR